MRTTLLIIALGMAGMGCAKQVQAAKPLTETPEQQVGTLAPNTGIPVGQKIPDVHARDSHDKDVALSSYLERGPMMLVFYRGGWCPSCNLEIRLLSESALDFERRGVSLVAVSVDKLEEAAKLKEKYTVPFPVLSDVDAKAINAFHVVNQVTPEQYAKMRGNNVDLEKASGRTHHEIAVPSFFLIDRDGVVRWAHSDPDWKVRPSSQQLLAAIDTVFPPDD